MDSVDPTPRAPARLEALPTWQLGQAAARAHRLVQEALATEGARGYHFRVLATLEESGPLSQAELGRRSGIHVSDIVATVNDLAGDESVVRSPDPADRRRNVIAITATGRQRLARMETRLAEVQEAVLEPLSADERTQLVTLLRRLRDLPAQ